MSESAISFVMSIFSAEKYFARLSQHIRAELPRLQTDLFERSVPCDDRGAIPQSRRSSRGCHQTSHMQLLCQFVILSMWV